MSVAGRRVARVRLACNICNEKLATFSIPFVTLAKLLLVQIVGVERATERKKKRGKEMKETVPCGSNVLSQ